MYDFHFMILMFDTSTPLICGFRRKNLTAWHGGDNLVKAVAAQNNNTIVIVHSVGPLIVEPWIEHPNVTAVRRLLTITSRHTHAIV